MLNWSGWNLSLQMRSTWKSALERDCRARFHLRQRFRTVYNLPHRFIKFAITRARDRTGPEQQSHVNQELRSKGGRSQYG